MIFKSFDAETIVENNHSTTKNEKKLKIHQEWNYSDKGNYFRLLLNKIEMMSQIPI